MKIRIKWLLILSFLMTGCEIDKYTHAYIDFIDTYGSEDRYYCDEETNFFMHEFIRPKSEHTTITPIFNNAGDAISCGCENQT